MNARPVSPPKSPPRRTTSVPGDVLAFLLHRPTVPTLVSFDSPEEREAYSHRILQRIGVDVSSYSVLNLHQIGIELEGATAQLRQHRVHPDLELCGVHQQHAALGSA